MKKVLTETEFQRAIRGLDVGQQTIEIAHGVLVEQRPQTEFAAALGLSKGAVSQAVNRVWAAHEQQNMPPGYERVTAVLPGYQAHIVKRWAQEAKKHIGEK